MKEITVQEFAEKYKDRWVRCSESGYSFEGKICGYSARKGTNGLVLVSHTIGHEELHTNDVVLSESDTGKYWYAFVGELTIL